MIVLNLMLRNLGLKQSDVLKCLKEKYGFEISSGEFSRKCREQGRWWGGKAQELLELLDKEYGIYYDVYCWRVRDNDGE